MYNVWSTWRLFLSRDHDKIVLFGHYDNVCTPLFALAIKIGWGEYSNILDEQQYNGMTEKMILTVIFI